jgi:hypothetical protein
LIRVRLAGGPGLVFLDVLVLAWALAWLGAGIVVSREARGLAELSDTAAQTGQAAIAVGEAVRALPFVGDRLQEAADEVRRAGGDAIESAAAARASARRVGDLLGVAIATIPNLPLLLIYVPARAAATRERRDVERALRTLSRDEVDHVLAVRAAARLPLGQLLEARGDVGADVDSRLADRELRRLGVTRPRAGAPQR